MNRLIVGMIAGTLTTIAFLPQVIKIYKTKMVKDLSIVTFCMYFLGVFLWVVYGFILKELPIIIANTASLVLIITIIVMKIKYRL